jgi:hypothetical protein
MPRDVEMNQRKMTEVIATRQIEILCANGTRDQIGIEIGRPAQGLASTFYCPYRLRGAGIDKELFGAGVDTVDALLNAMIMVGIELENLPSRVDGTLRWEGGQPGDFGFPKLPL